MALPRRWQLMTPGKDIEARFQRYDVMTYREVIALARSSEAEVERLDRLIGPEKRDPDTHKLVNRIMAPALRRMGYRTLRQFEAAYHAHGGDPPWPRRGAVNKSPCSGAFALVYGGGVPTNSRS